MNSRQILSPIRTPKRVRLLSARWQERGVVLLSAVMLMMTISSCTFKVMDGDNPTESKEMSYLTISAVLDVPGDTAGSHLRSAAEGTWTPIDGSENQPVIHHDGEGNSYQYKVNTLRVLLFDNNNYGKRYMPDGFPLVFTRGDGKVQLSTPDAGQAQVSTTLSNSFTFPTIEVPKGSYHIVVVANASGTTALHLDNDIQRLSDLEAYKMNLNEYYENNDDNQIINQTKLEGMVDNDNVGFPMVGELPIAVAEGGTRENPVQVGNIGISRVVSYLRMVVTNLDKEGHVFPGTAGWRILEMGVVNGGKNSRLLERRNSPMPVSDLKYWHKGSGARNEWIDWISWGLYGPPSSTNIGSFENGVPTQFNYEVYVTEKIGIENSSDYLYYKVVMSKGNDTKTYMIPFYSGTDAHRDYNIYRNTLYSITAYFKGGELETSVKAVPWSAGSTINKKVNSNEYAIK